LRLLLDWRCSSEGFDSLSFLHVANHFKVVYVLFGPVQPVVELVVEVKSLFSHLTEHLTLHLGLTQLHEELSSGWGRNVATGQLLKSGTMLSNDLAEPFPLLLGLFIGSKVSTEKADVLVHSILFGDLASVSFHQVLNCVQVLKVSNCLRHRRLLLSLNSI